MTRPKYGTIDAHLHVVNFLQDTQGLKTLLQRMDEANIDKAVIFGLPVAKAWSEWERYEPSYYLSDNSRCYYYAMTDVTVARLFLDLTESERSRFIPLLCGFNPVDKHAVKHIERITTLFPGVFRGIGEVLCRHDDLTDLMLGQPPRADHPALEDIYAYAGEEGVPVVVHQDITSVGRDDPIYLEELARALEAHPDTTFVWAHAGHSRRVEVEDYPRFVGEALERYPNLNLDLSWYVFDRLVCPEGEPSEAWLNLAESYGGRICIGSDIFGEFDALQDKMARFTPFWDALSIRAREDVAMGAAERIYGSAPALGV